MRLKEIGGGMTEIDKTIEEVIADNLPFESWERLQGETSAAFSAFCSYRDFGLERNIRKAVEAVEKDVTAQAKKYKVWRNWSTQYRWRERAADYDKYIERLKQAEMRKTIEAQGEKHREVTKKMLDVVSKKLDTMNPADLSQGSVTEWVQTAIKADREAEQFADANCFGVSASRNSSLKQGELNFVSDFQGL
jgi:hypothetical protein